MGPQDHRRHHHGLGRADFEPDARYLDNQIPSPRAWRYQGVPRPRQCSRLSAPDRVMASLPHASKRRRRYAPPGACAPLPCRPNLRRTSPCCVYRSADPLDLLDARRLLLVLDTHIADRPEVLGTGEVIAIFDTDRLASGYLRELERHVDPTRLRLRVAAVALSLPPARRVQEPGWPLHTASEWISPTAG